MNEEEFYALKKQFVAFITDDGTCADKAQIKKSISLLQLEVERAATARNDGLRVIVPGANQSTKDTIEARNQFEQRALNEAIAETLGGANLSHLKAAKFSAARATGTGIRGYRIIDSISWWSLEIVKAALFALVFGVIGYFVLPTIILHTFSNIHDPKKNPYLLPVVSIFWGAVGGLWLWQQLFKKKRAEKKEQVKRR